MRTRLQSNVHGGAVYIVSAAARILQRLDFRVIATGALGKALAQNQSVAHDDTPYARIGRRVQQRTLAQFECELHEAVIGLGIHGTYRFYLRSRPALARTGCKKRGHRSTQSKPKAFWRLLGPASQRLRR